MDPDRIELTLLPAADDPAPDGADYQAALWAADRTLREHGVKASSSMFRQDDAETPAIHLGQMVVKLGPYVAPALAAVIGVWVQARFGRKARLKVGDVEAEARTPEEVAQLLELVPEIRDSKPKELEGP
ncbi:hypothetical protein GCM10009416_11640 [Craurococcus roseus]|uniref:Uncharacterized protein n=1 Tax=Craurococcus roseus TaxID=77585 RepID=A0ABP3PYH0_9PROT